ncbi:MAG TPA: uracil-DNA glycosylase [Candidatus Baltobacteraceae bacterium]|nr:uracil-DNA glycosylase [Candidatus Baltobacteraceae bacterium]
MTLSERAARERLLAKAAATAAACRKCQIGFDRRNNVYGEGDPCARLMLVGEGPGETEDLLGRPFVGRAGELLDKMLAAIDLPREDVYICNTVKCRPTLHDGGKLRNRAPTPHEMANCRAYLDEQIDIIAPAVILALGAPAAKSFLGSDFGITKGRGRWYAGPNGIPLMVTFHPAYVLRQGGMALTETKRQVWSDLKQVRARLDEAAAAAAQSAPPGAASAEQISLL